MAKNLLDTLNVSHDVFMIDESKEHFDAMQKRVPNARTVPQIFINDTSIGGFDDLNQLHQEGKLDAMLSE